MFANDPENWGLMPGWVIPKTKNWYLMPPYLTLSIIWIKGKQRNPEKGVVAIENGTFGSLSTTVDQLYIYVYMEANNIWKTIYREKSINKFLLLFGLPCYQSFSIYVYM